ncbi:conserved hypothetical protein [Tenacibaculum maritimum]|nr:conserved hypothetical protein [Tenacibaculum maritimum]CAA0200395.1 conserved hypothetical protein [Tenacibaculum maritimum]
MNMNTTPMSFIMVFVLSVFSISCVKNIDIDQVNDFVATPEVKLALINFYVTQTNLVIEGTDTEINEVVDTSKFNAFDNSVMQNNLERAVLEFKIQNQFDRIFEVEFLFLDENDQIMYSVPTLVINGAELEHKEEVIVANTPAFLAAKQIQTRLRLKPTADGSIIDVKDPKKINFQSGVTLYLKIE